MIGGILRNKTKFGVRTMAALIGHSSGYSLSRLQGKAVILMYHRVIPEKLAKQEGVQPGMFVSDEVFAQQMSFLRKHFRIISLAELLARWKDDVWDTAERYCVLTFDDGWRDNYVYAYPILKKNQLPATIFLPTAFIGTTQRFWPDKLIYALRECFLHARQAELSGMYEKWPCMKQQATDMTDRIDLIVEAVKVLSSDAIEALLEELMTLLNVRIPEERTLLNWTEAAEMSQHDITFGSHSASHAILTTLGAKRLQQEIAGSLETLYKKKIKTVPVFCYPNGNYTKEIAAAVQAAGYAAAVTTKFGFEQRSGQKLFELKRVGVHQDISRTTPLFSARLSGLSQLLRGGSL